MKSLPTLLAGALNAIYSATPGLHDDQKRQVEETVVALRERGDAIDRAFAKDGGDGDASASALGSGLGVYAYGLTGVTLAADADPDPAAGVYGYGKESDLIIADEIRTEQGGGVTFAAPAPEPELTGDDDTTVSGAGDGVEITDAQATALDRDGDGEAGGSLPEGFGVSENGEVWTADGDALVQFVAPNAFVFRAVRDANLIGVTGLFHDAGAGDGKKPAEFEWTDFTPSDETGFVAVFDADSVAIIHRPPAEGGAVAPEQAQDGQNAASGTEQAESGQGAQAAVSDAGGDQTTTTEAVNDPPADKKPKK